MRKLFLLFFGLVLFATAALAQRTITGKVIDEKGNAVANASVVVKGTTTGTTTKADGTYSLALPANAKVLVISSVDMLTLELNIGSQTSINAVLKGEDKVMQEVVVVGYGTQQKKAFTGSASKVDAKEFANLITPSVDKQLAGRATGVQVTNQSGLVNQPARIFIRGINSISQSTGPLFVVDGVPIISGNLAATTNSNALGDINPADIESIDVLKDGSATAIYGSRGAPGVILITTKKGSKGRSRVTYDMSLGFSNALKKFELLNADQFVTIANEKLANVGLAARAGVNPGGVNTDWQGIALVDNALVQNHNLSFSGGGPKTTFFFSVNYSKNQGVVISNKNTAYRIRMNAEHEVNNFMKVGNNLSVSRQVDADQNNGSNALSGSIASALRLLPNVAAYSSTNSSGYNINYPASNAIPAGPNSQGVDDNYTNVAFTLNANKFSSDKYRIIENAFMELNLAKGLKFRSQGAVDFFDDYSFQSLDPRHGDGFSSNGIAFNQVQNQLRTNWQNYLNYNLKLGGNSFFLTAGHEIERQTNKTISSQGSNVADLFFLKENLISGAASTQSVGGGFAQRSFTSLFTRINYDYKNKYFVQASIRRDGLSSLAKDKRFGNFPGFSAGWRISEERGWRNNKFLSKWFTDVKLKASYAKVGNPLSGFPYLTATFGPAPYGNINGIALNSIGNPDLKWETSVKYDVGAEINMFRGRLNLTIDHFTNDINDLVFAVPTPASAGIPGNTIQQNVGKMTNKGFEFAMDLSIVRKKDFNWDFNFNYSHVSNEIKALYSIGGVPKQFITNGAYNLLKVGEAFNIIYGYKSAGVNTANGNPMYYKADGRLVQHNIANNTFYYITGPNDGTISAANATTMTFDDRQKLGQGVPTFFGAFTNNFRYRQFELEVMFRYSGGNQIMNTTAQEALYSQSFHNNGVGILDRWTKPGQQTDVPKLYYGQSNNVNQVGLAISRFVENGDYLRLQNLVMSYTVDKALLGKIFKGYMESARFFVQGQNLFVWSKYKGADPDNITAGGIDQSVSPQVRTVSVGVSVGF